MVVRDHDAPTGHRPARSRRTIRVEPLVELDWFHAVESAGVAEVARRPADTRRAWLHRAPTDQVLAQYKAVREVLADPPAPWWLRGLAAGLLPSRAAGFAVEDRVTEVLAARPGWAYMPWIGPGEDGYWEYMPSETTAGTSRVPTAVQFTDRHPGWLDVLPAHTEGAVEPIPLDGVDELRARVEELERH